MRTKLTPKPVRLTGKGVVDGTMTWTSDDGITMFVAAPGREPLRASSEIPWTMEDAKELWDRHNIADPQPSTFLVPEMGVFELHSSKEGTGAPPAMVNVQTVRDEDTGTEHFVMRLALGEGDVLMQVVKDTPWALEDAMLLAQALYLTQHASPFPHDVSEEDLERLRAKIEGQLESRPRD